MYTTDRSYIGEYPDTAGNGQTIRISSHDEISVQYDGADIILSTRYTYLENWNESCNRVGGLPYTDVQLSIVHCCQF